MSNVGGDTRKKVDLEGIKRDMISEIEKIDGDENLTRSQKTKLIGRLATKVKSRLFNDRRRNSDSKLALSTYRKYMTNLRNAVSSKNWVHHSLDEQIVRISKKHPEISENLGGLRGLCVADLRVAHKALKDSLIGDPDAYEAIKDMKLDHEIMRHLTLRPNQKAQMAESESKSLDKKKSNTIEINTHWLDLVISDLLGSKTKGSGEARCYSFSRLALGVALVTGRRSIEVLHQGQFEKTGKNKLMFFGQAKKRGGTDPEKGFEIYTLVDADVVLEAIDQLRQLPEVKALDEYAEMPEVQRNDAINKRVSKTLNQTTKSVFGDDKRVFKDSRSIYARVALEKFYSTDPKWKKMDEDKFFEAIMGHEGERFDAQLHYKSIKLNHEKQQEPKKKKTAAKNNPRLAKLIELDDDPEVMRRAALAKIHEWAKEKLREGPGVTITQSMISREVGSIRPAIKDYLALIEGIDG